jgi:copper homeostasis protein
MPAKYIIEIATSDLETTRAAVNGGADRIELCANLAEGGTTPSWGTIRKCRELFSVTIFPIIRPRGGDFLYSSDEIAAMKADVKVCRESGCDGVVIGLLNADGSIDLRPTAALIELAYPLGVTFHRAFDRCRDPFEAMEQLISIGCERILTSGQMPSVTDGVELVAKLNEAADGRIIIMPGSGVRKENIKMLEQRTGCAEFHSSLRGKKRSAMNFIHPAFASGEESYTNNHIDPLEVRALRNALE